MTGGDAGQLRTIFEPGEIPCSSGTHCGRATSTSGMAFDLDHRRPVRNREVVNPASGAFGIGVFRTGYATALRVNPATTIRANVFQ